MRLLFLLFCFTFSLLPYAQTLSGKLSYHNEDTIRMYGFNGFEHYLIYQDKADSAGYFKLYYGKHRGVGFLKGADNKPYFLILNGEDISLSGTALSLYEEITIHKGKENQLFNQYASEYPRREQTLSAWRYLSDVYQQDTLFIYQKGIQSTIKEEQERIKTENRNFLDALPTESYSKWYLPMRTLVSSVSSVAQHRPEKIPSTIEALREIDYADERLYRSGLLKDAIDGHFWLIENSGISLDSVYSSMQISIDSMLVSLKSDDEKLNKITGYLFTLLEKHSLNKAAEYLALSILDDDDCGCSIQPNLADKLEQYRAMKEGNVAPDFYFPEAVVNLPKGKENIRKLSDLESDYQLLIFGASWCKGCIEEIPEIIELYEEWEKKGVQAIFISLDVKKERFEHFASYFPFPSVCDYQKWESPIAKSYYVHATPTMYLLNKNREIVLKPKSIKHIDAWIKWKL